MPLIEVSIARGRSQGQLRSLISELHRAAETAVGATPENTTVIIREIEHEHWSRGNQTIAERAAASRNAADAGQTPASTDPPNTDLPNTATEQRSL